MQRVTTLCLILSFVLLVTFAVVLGTAEVLDGLGDAAAALVFRYVGLGVGIAWLINQIMLITIVSLLTVRRMPLQGIATDGMVPEEMRFSGEEPGDDEESAMPPRG